MKHRLLIHVIRKERYQKVFSIEDRGQVIYYREENNLYDLRDSETLGQARESYQSSWPDMWHYFKGLKDLYRWVEEPLGLTYFPDWLLLDPVFIAPERKELFSQELDKVIIEFKLKEYEMERINVWRNACQK